MVRTRGAGHRVLALSKVRNLYLHFPSERTLLGARSRTARGWGRGKESALAKRPLGPTTPAPSIPLHLGGGGSGKLPSSARCREKRWSGLPSDLSADLGVLCCVLDLAWSGARKDIPGPDYLDTCILSCPRSGPQCQLNL